MAPRETRLTPAHEAPHTGVAFRDFAEKWLADAVLAGNRCEKSNRSILDQHLLPEFGAADLAEVDRRRFRAFVFKLKTHLSKRTKRPLAPRTVRNVVRLLHTLMAEAVDQELLPLNPIVPGRRDMPKMVDRDPTWRPGAIFLREEVKLLLTSTRVKRLTRILVALGAMTGARAGELAALRFSDYEPLGARPVTSERPLGKVTYARQYATADKAIRNMKTDVARVVPVHPILGAILDAWWDYGWKEVFGRDPSTEDLVVPAELDEQDLFADGVPMRNDGATQRMHSACAAVSIRRRGPHVLRATFLSLLQADGASPEVLESMTHNKAGNRAGDVVGGYTRFPFRVLCDAVLKLKLDLGEGPGQEPQSDLPRTPDAPERCDLPATTMRREPSDQDPDARAGEETRATSLRSGAVAARRAHAPKAGGSIPSSAIAPTGATEDGAPEFSRANERNETWVGHRPKSGAAQSGGTETT